MKLVPSGKQNGRVSYRSEDGSVRVYYAEHRAGPKGSRVTVAAWYAHSTVERDMSVAPVCLADGKLAQPLKDLCHASTLAGLKKKLAAV